MKAHSPNYNLIIVFAVITVFGIIMLTSASQVIAFSNFNDSYYYLKHQIIYGFLPGLVLFVLLSHIEYTKWKKMAFPLLILTVTLLVLVLIPQFGFSHGGAKRWLVFGPVNFQPSEFAKISLVIFFSAWLSQKSKQIKSFHYTFLPFLAYTGLIVLLIALEPDVGTLTVIVMIALAMYFTAGMKISHLSLFLLIGILGFGILVYAAPYRLARFTTFLNPQTDTLGISYQINQSLLAIGSGGVFGQGFGQSKQKYQYLPEVAGDSIFAIIAEELGFIITALFLGLFLYAVVLGFTAAGKSSDDFAKYLAVGITTWFAYQSIVNVSAMVGLMPLTGLPFPFVSYGGSALIASMGGVGLLVNISKYTK